MRVAVIDDERPARSELRHQLLKLLPGAVIEEGESGARALEMAGEAEYDLFFLDINLGDGARECVEKYAAGDEDHIRDGVF